MTPVLDAARREELRKLAETAHVHGWRCPFCNCQTFARCDELEQHGYAPGDDVRCVSCKHVSYWTRFNETADTTLALLAYIAELEAGLRPFVAIRDQDLAQTSKLISKSFDGFSLITVHVTKDQLLAAAALLPKA